MPSPSRKKKDCVTAIEHAYDDCFLFWSDETVAENDCGRCFFFSFYVRDFGIRTAAAATAVLAHVALHEARITCVD